jgi:hypothetical protein
MEGDPLPTEQPSQFRHRQRLTAEKSFAVAEQGPEVLSPGESACLLLNPYALYDLADFIIWRLPDYWRAAQEEDARDYCERHNIHIPIPGLDEPPQRPLNG